MSRNTYRVTFEIETRNLTAEQIRERIAERIAEGELGVDDNLNEDSDIDTGTIQVTLSSRSAWRIVREAGGIPL